QIYATNLSPPHPSIRYGEGPFDNPVTPLDASKLTISPGGLGYLPSLLEHLGINPDSQALVFSKTSFQAGKISPRNPPAIYFNDEVAVGWVRGSEGVEVAATDPRQGTVFYTLDGSGRFTRQEVCL